MPQFLISGEDLSGGTFRLAGEEAHHAAKARHLRQGDAISLFDGRGRTFEGRIKTIEADGTITGVIERELSSKSSEGRSFRLDLYQSLIKGARWDWLIEKGTELGVSNFIPVLSQRSVIELKGPEGFKAKKSRSERLAVAAAKQCGRADLPQVLDPMTFEAALTRSRENDGVALLAWEDLKEFPGAQDDRPFWQSARERLRASGGAVGLFIGPEGGFSSEEIEQARKAGAMMFSLGPLVLRAETAAIAALAVIQHELQGLSARGEG